MHDTTLDSIIIKVLFLSLYSSVCNYMSHNHDLLYSISLSQCYPEVNPTELFAHHAQLSVLSLTKPCTVNVTGQKQRLYPLR